MTLSREGSLVIVTSNYWPEPTGTGRATSELADYLSRTGVRVEVVTAMPFYPQWSIWPEYRGKLWLTESHQGVTVRRSWHRVRPRPSVATRLLHDLTLALFALPQMIRAFWGARTVYVVSPSQSLATLALFVSRLAPVHRVLLVHDVLPDSAIELDMLASGPARGAARLLARAAYALADEIHTIGEGMKERIASGGPPAGKIKVVPNTIDPGELAPIPPADNEFRRRLTAPGSFVVLHFGNMGRKQDLDLLLRVAARLRHDPEVEFHVVGEGATKHEFLMRRDALRLSNVRHHPLQERWMLPHMLSGADVVLVSQVPQLRNTVLPSKLSTALGAGALVVAACSEESDIARVMSESGAGLWVPAGDDDAVLRALDSVRRGHVDVARMRQNAREYALRTFSRDVVLAPLARELNGTAEGSRTP